MTIIYFSYKYPPSLRVSIAPGRVSFLIRPAIVRPNRFCWPKTPVVLRARRSFFRGSQFALEKSRGTSRHPVVRGLIRGPERPTAHERETGIRARNKTRRPVFFTFLSPSASLQPLSSSSPCALLSLFTLLPSDGAVPVLIYTRYVCARRFFSQFLEICKKLVGLWRLFSWTRVIVSIQTTTTTTIMIVRRMARRRGWLERGCLRLSTMYI